MEKESSTQSIIVSYLKRHDERSSASVAAIKKRMFPLSIESCNRQVSHVLSCSHAQHQPTLEGAGLFRVTRALIFERASLVSIVFSTCSVFLSVRCIAVQ